MINNLYLFIRIWWRFYIKKQSRFFISDIWFCFPLFPLFIFREIFKIVCHFSCPWDGETIIIQDFIPLSFRHPILHFFFIKTYFQWRASSIACQSVEDPFISKLILHWKNDSSIFLIHFLFLYRIYIILYCTLAWFSLLVE